MINNSRLYFFLVFLFNVFIAALFFYKGSTQSYVDLSSDQLNIVPMCKKLDNQSLFQEDLFLDDIKNFEYYTPFFVEPLRFVKNKLELNYFEAINLLHSLTHFIYGITWFILFFFLTGRNILISLVISILVRGIFWLPGMEIWGISEIWSFMPRTVYIALMPIPFLLLFSKPSFKVTLASLLIGFIFNFHPITGLGGILIMIITLTYFSKEKYLNVSISQFLLALFFIIVGMTPFLINYFGKTDVGSNYDLKIYESAFDTRIPSYFKSMGEYFQRWIEFKTLFIIIPIIALYVIPLFAKLKFKYRNYILIMLSILFSLPLLSIWVENQINLIFDLNLRMSFQLVRIQKLVVIPGFLSILYIIYTIYLRNEFFKKTTSVVLFLYLILIPFSSSTFFQNVPFISDDITKMIFPNFNKIESNTDILEIGEYISKNTPVNSVFYNQTILRTISNRSVKLDHKGASILIEGNPIKFIDWFNKRQEINMMDDKLQQFEFLKKIGVTHVLSENSNFPFLKRIKTLGKYNLYELNGL